MSVGRVTHFQYYLLSLLLLCYVFAVIFEVSILLEDGFEICGLMLALMHNCEVVDDRKAANFVLIVECFLGVIGAFEQALLDCVLDESVETTAHFNFLYGFHSFIG